MRKLRWFTVTMATMMAAAALIGVAGVGTAKAASVGPDYLCNYYNQYDPSETVCAYGNGSSQVGMDWIALPIHMTRWLIPDAGFGYGNIQQANTNLCMQLDAADGYIVKEATCKDTTSQKWEWAGSSGLQIRSQWNPGLCLNYNAGGQSLNVLACNGNAWYQRFIVG